MTVVTDGDDLHWNSAQDIRRPCTCRHGHGPPLAGDKAREVHEPLLAANNMPGRSTSRSYTTGSRATAEPCHREPRPKAIAPSTRHRQPTQPPPHAQNTRSISGDGEKRARHVARGGGGARPTTREGEGVCCLDDTID